MVKPFSLAVLALAQSHPPTARRVLAEQEIARTDDWRERPEVYTAAVSAALPHMRPDHAEFLRMVWDALRAGDLTDHPEWEKLIPEDPEWARPLFDPFETVDPIPAALFPAIYYTAEKP